jgi:hypothetical protein
VKSKHVEVKVSDLGDKAVFVGKVKRTKRLKKGPPDLRKIDPRDRSERRRADEREVLKVLSLSGVALPVRVITKKLDWASRRRPRSALSAVLDQLAKSGRLTKALVDSDTKASGYEYGIPKRNR